MDATNKTNISVLIQEFCLKNGRGSSAVETVIFRLYGNWFICWFSLFLSFSLFFSLYSVALGSPRLLSYPPSPPSSALRPPLSFPLIRPYPWLWPPCRLLVPLARGHSLPPPAFLRLVLSLSIYPSLYRVPFVGHREVAPSSPSPSFPPPSIPPFVCVYTTHICTYIYILMFIFSAAASCCRDEISGIPFKHLKESLE